MRQRICGIFNKWCDEILPRYFEGFDYEACANKRFYHETLNPYLKTESDIQVKFGGYLEEALLPVGYTVHSEQTGIYKTQARIKPRPDLSVHQVDKKDGLWLSGDPDPVVVTLKAVIEIKYANFIGGNKPFIDGKIEQDITNMSDLLGEDIIKFMLIFDEGGEIHPEHIDSTRQLASQKGVFILSNNKDLHLC
jgi:hypothetical protein